MQNQVFYLRNLFNTSEARGLVGHGNKRNICAGHMACSGGALRPKQLCSICKEKLQPTSKSWGGSQLKGENKRYCSGQWSSPCKQPAWPCEGCFGHVFLVATDLKEKKKGGGKKEKRLFILGKLYLYKKILRNCWASQATIKYRYMRRIGRIRFFLGGVFGFWGGWFFLVSFFFLPPPPDCTHPEIPRLSRLLLTPLILLVVVVGKQLHR